LYHAQHLLYSAIATSAIFALPSNTFAETPVKRPTIPVDFEWLRGHGAEGCPDAPKIAREIENKAGRKVFTTGAQHKIEVLITRVQNEWTARIEERAAPAVVKTGPPISTEADDCNAIKEAAVFNVMVLIDHPEDPAPPAPPPLQLAVTARVALSYGLVPGTSPEMGLFGSLGRTWWEISTGLSWMPESATKNGNFAFGLTTAWLGGCLHPLRRRHVMLSGCGYILAGGMHNTILAADVFLRPENRPSDIGEQGWAGGAISPRLRFFPTNQFVIELGGNLIAPFTLRKFSLQGGPVVYEQLPVAVAGYFGVGVSIP
jgi:hypothetical protein